MDDVAASIKAFVLVLYPGLLDEVGISDGQLDFFVQDVIDRALSYMRRNRLVRQYEEDLEDYPITNTSDRDEAYYTYWRNYEYPIPKEVERVLAKTIVGVARNFKNSLTATNGAVVRVKDQGQEVQFSEVLSNFLTTSSDSDIFSGSLGILNRYKLVKTVGNAN